MLPPIVTAGIVLLLVIFILLQREDLRDRLIRFLGVSDLQRATSAINDAATRLSQYFLRQLIINLPSASSSPSGFGSLGFQRRSCGASSLCSCGSCPMSALILRPHRPCCWRRRACLEHFPAHGKALRRSFEFDVTSAPVSKPGRSTGLTALRRLCPTA